MPDFDPAAVAVPPDACTVIELRQYTLHPGSRNTFIALFDREFIESQEDLGSWVFGQFRDCDHPDRVVWLRGFRDMPARASALTAFYGGPVWQAHRDAANATIIDSDDVLLLRPVAPAPLRPVARSTDLSAKDAGLVVITICHFDAPVGDGFLAFFQEELAPMLTDAGAALHASLITEASANNFRLPVREGEHVFVWIAGFSDPVAYQRHFDALARSAHWRERIAPALAAHLQGPPEVLRLAPTSRSRWRG